MYAIFRGGFRHGTGVDVIAGPPPAQSLAPSKRAVKAKRIILKVGFSGSQFDCFTYAASHHDLGSGVL